MKINVVGWYGKNNVGDEAFRCVFRQALRGHDLKFVTPPASCNDCDVVILGGGAVVSPFYLNGLPDKPRYAIGVDIAYLSEMDLLTPLGFKGIMVRNKTDIATLRSKVSCEAESIPDLAFFLQRSGTDVLSHYRKTNKKPLGVFATDYVNPALDRSVEKFTERANSFKVNLAAELDKMAHAGYEVILAPCATGGYGDDRRINLDLAAFMRTEPTIIFDTLGPQAMIDLIADLDVAVCMRFHAHIFSMIAGTPFVSIEFTRKVKLFLEENNLTQCTAGLWKDKEFDISTLREKLEMVSNSSMQQYLSATASSYHEALYHIMRKVRREWLEQSS